MGTNYYLDFHPYSRTNPMLHICKSFRSFRGYVEPHHFVDRYVPKLVSWEDWKTYLTSTIVDDPAAEAVVRSEYGTTIDLAEFIYLVEAVPYNRRRAQYDAVGYSMHKSPVSVIPVVLGIHHGGDWLDSEGYSFHGGEFS